MKNFSEFLFRRDSALSFSENQCLGLPNMCSKFHEVLFGI